MAFRLWSKGIMMITREKKLFVMFTLIYTILIFLTSLFLELTLANEAQNSAMFVAIFFLTSLILSILYAFLLVSRNRRNWATLKCIGYTNKDVNAIIRGIILFTMALALFIVIEVLFHYAAIIAYLADASIDLAAPPVLVGLLAVVLTSLIFIGVQLIAIFIANRRVLKVRPMVALKKPGE